MLSPVVFLQYETSTRSCHCPLGDQQSESDCGHAGICEQVQQHQEQHTLAAK